MKNVLFIGVTNYNFQKPESLAHLKSKFLGLSRGMNVFTLAKGKPFYKKIWNTEFYLLSPNLLFWPLAFFLGFYLCLAKKIDTIVAQSPLTEGFVGSIFKKILRKELIVEIHGDWRKGPFLSKKRKLELIQRKFVPILARISLKSADKIRAISTFTMEKAQEICFNKPYFVFPTFTDLDPFLDEVDLKFENFILFVGNLFKIKGINVLIEAFSQVSNEFPDFKLILIGEGPEKQKLRAQGENLKVIDRIEFKGRLSLVETKEIMKNCYCLVLPSLSEGLGRVLVEAMALRKPVIGSRVGGIPDLIKDGQNGFLFKVKDSREMAEKLEVLLKDKNLAIKMGENGREFIQDNFSNERYLQNFINMINA